MAGLLEQFSKGLFGLAPTPAPNGVFGQVLDSAAQWGRGVQDKAANIQTTLADLLRNPSNALPNIPPQTLANLLQQPVTPEQKQNIASKALDFGMEFGPLATVWHGSPHLFNKFDMSKIGTGEGAQAYGHGLYFAETPDVAKAYRSNLVKEPSFLEKRTGKIINKDSPQYQDLLERQARMERNGYGAEFDKKYEVQEGALYKVDLPDEHIAKMLDWDKPLSQQAPEVQKILSDLGTMAGMPSKFKIPSLSKDIPASDFYNALDNVLGGRAAVTEKLKKLGIPGIRYLDGGSRAGGKGTSNFVVFDDAIPKIIGRE